MSKKCFISGKTTTFGRSRKHNYGGGWEHRAHATSRTWKPNLRKLRIVENGTPRMIWISMRYYKKLKQEMATV